MDDSGGREGPGRPGGRDRGEDAPASADPGAGLPGKEVGAPGKGLSTGAKVAIGCGIAGGVAILAVAAVVVAGGLFLGRQARDLAGGAERQAEATATLERLREEHAFTPPEDGSVGADRARSFFTVTDDAWEEMREWAGEVEALSERSGEERPGLEELTAGLRGLSGLWRSRAVLAETLDEHEMSLGEYLWTGLALARAREALEGGSPEGVPAANLELARRFEDRFAELTGSDEGGADKGVVLGLAVVWGMGEPDSWRALGLDTLYRGR